jgi:glycosyltransferase involved in cell wall biosynthesis
MLLDARADAGVVRLVLADELRPRGGECLETIVLEIVVGLRQGVSLGTRRGIATEYIEQGKNGLVVDYKDADGIYKAIKTYLSDEALKNKIIATAKKDVEDLFSLEKMNAELKKIYLSE